MSAREVESAGGAIAATVREVDPTQGRVRVEYHQIEDGLESTWAYVAAPLAGPQRGMLFMPEPGDEVLVIHGHEDFDHPFVIGYLWNGRQRSPETDREMRVIKTPGGHQLRFEDKAGHRKIVLRSDGKRLLTLDDLPGLGRIELVSGSHRVLMDDNPAATRVQLQAGQGVGVTVTMNATPVPSLVISVGGATTINIGPAGISITSAGATNLSVAGVANVSASSVNVNAAAATINAGALAVNAGIATFSGVVQCATLVTGSVVSPLYTPGLGNLI